MQICRAQCRRCTRWRSAPPQCAPTPSSLTIRSVAVVVPHRYAIRSLHYDRTRAGLLIRPLQETKMKTIILILAALSLAACEMPGQHHIVHAPYYIDQHGTLRLTGDGRDDSLVPSGAITCSSNKTSELLPGTACYIVAAREEQAAMRGR